MNPELKKGDRVVLIKMSDPYSPVPPMTGGVVMSSSEVFGDTLYYINWDNGQRLNLISGEDIWLLEDDFNRKRKKTKIDVTESRLMINAYSKNKPIIKNYKFTKIFKFLAAIRATGIVNMLQSSYFLTCGEEQLEHFVKYVNVNNKKALRYAIENAEEVRTLMIGGAIKMIEDKNKEITPSSVERQIKIDSNKFIELFASFPITNEFQFDDDYDEDGYEDDEDGYEDDEEEDEDDDY